MNIKGVSNTDFVFGSTPQRETARASKAEGKAGLIADFSSRAALARALHEVPDVRSEAVARGRELYKDVPYPPTTILNGVSHLIAKYLIEKPNA